MDLTIEQLAKQATRHPNRAGSGYIKLPVNINGEYYAYRFYSEEILPRSNDQVHTHTYTFHSKTIKGTLRNIIYDVIPTDEDTDFYLTQGVCHAGEWENHITTSQNIKLIEKEQFTTSPGEDYILKYDIFHRIRFDTRSVITILRPLEKADIGCCQYVIDRNVGLVDPWGEKLTVSQCWEVIRECLLD